MLGQGSNQLVSAFVDQYKGYTQAHQCCTSHALAHYLYIFSLHLQQHDKILVLKRKYRPESHEDSNNDTTRASSEPPGGANMSSSGDRPDGVAPSKMRSDGNLSSFDNMLSASASSSISLGSCVSTSSLVW